jgi:hypothetical protein
LALECISNGTDSRGNWNNLLLLESMLLSNHAMCELKLAEVKTEAMPSSQRSSPGTHLAEANQGKNLYNVASTIALQLWRVWMACSQVAAASREKEAAVTTLPITG